MKVNAEQICCILQELQTQAAAFDQILKKAVRLIHESDDAFDWTGIYELTPGEVLRLGPFIGEPTDHILIPAGKGICGSAVSEGRDKVVPDVSKEANYLACSVATKSEAVILIQKNGRVFGQIDIDSHRLNAFDEEKIRGLRKIAEWLADHYELRQP